MWNGSTITEINANGARQDGQVAVLKAGSYPDTENEFLQWISAARGGVGAWVGREISVISGRDLAFINQTKAEFGYHNSPPSGPVYGAYDLHGAIPFAVDKFAAGLRLQMKFSGRAKGTGTWPLELAPFLFTYGKVLGTNNRLSLNNDSQNISVANQQNGANTTISPGITLPADTTVAFNLTSLVNTAAFPNAAGVVVLLHANFDRPVRINYTSVVDENTLGGCTRVGTTYNLNNLVIPAGTQVWIGRVADFPPSGYNPNGLPTNSGTAAGPGDGNLGKGPSLTSPAGTGTSSGGYAITTGWQDVVLYRSFASGEIDTNRPIDLSAVSASDPNSAVKHFLYTTLYSRLATIPQATAPSGNGSSAWLSCKARWVTP